MPILQRSLSKKGINHRSHNSKIKRRWIELGDVVTACKDCNIAKADKSLDPSPVAIKPSYKALLKGQNSQIEYKDDMWREYIVA